MEDGGSPVRLGEGRDHGLREERRALRFAPHEFRRFTVQGRFSEVELFEGLEEHEVARLASIALPRSLRAGEYLFLLGDNAESLYVVLRGGIELCFPLSFGGTTRDVAIETMAVGRTLGWSSLVKPYRFTLSARAGVEAEVCALPRADLLKLFEEAPRIGYVFTLRLSGIIGRRLLLLQALWARELQRAVAGGFGPLAESTPAVGAGG